MISGAIIVLCRVLAFFFLFFFAGLFEAAPWGREDLVDA